MAENEEFAEVVAEEDVPIAEKDIEAARNLPAVRAHEAMVTRAEVTPAEVKEQRDKIMEVMRTVMVRDQHYGVIPGVNKPTLFKPGAEILAVTFRLAPHYKSERIFHDDGHLTVISNVTLVHIPSGLTIAEGEGLCTSREKKYAFRGSGRVCPTCGKTGTIKKSKFPPREHDYPGASSTDDPGWYCHGKAGGCGANFAAVDTSITSQSEEPAPNPDLADTFNTVLKMSNKRALIAAILNGTAASDIFTQDMEDAAGDGTNGGQQQTQQTERRQETAGRESKVPHTGALVKARLAEILGDEESEVWLAQVAEYAKGKTLAPTGLQRLGGVVVDLEGLGRDFKELPDEDAREKVQQVFAARFDGAVFSGPEWAMNGAEAEAGAPDKAEVLAAT